LTLSRDQERRTARINQLNRNRFCHFREALQDQDKQFQNRDDHEKSIEVQRQESSEERDLSKV
jgi:hypothetical protein